MIPALLIGIGIGYVTGHYTGRGSSPKLPVKSATPTAVTHGFGVCSPARARLHGHLLVNEHNPDKLMRAAGIYSQMGLDAQAISLATKAKDVVAQANIAAELVERSRSGDQNAIGMIASIRDNALTGDLRAKISMLLIDDYANAHPILVPPMPLVVPPPISPLASN